MFFRLCFRGFVYLKNIYLQYANLVFFFHFVKKKSCFLYKYVINSWIMTMISYNLQFEGGSKNNK